MIEGNLKGYVRLPVTFNGESVYWNEQENQFALEKSNCQYLVLPNAEELRSIARLVAQWREYRDTPTTDCGVSSLHLGSLLGLERVC